MAGKKRAAACRMAAEESMRPSVEGVIAVGQHLLGTVLRQPSAGLRMWAKQQSHTCLERAGTASCCIRMERCFSLMSGVWPY